MKAVKHWYKTTTYRCPVCGREEIDKERAYTPKPKDRNKRFIIKEWYDNCER